MRLLSLITLMAIYQWTIAAPLFSGIKFPLTRALVSKHKAVMISSPADFEEIRERIVKIVVNVTKYSGKVQNGISKMDVEKNKLSEESSAAVAKQKQLVDGRHALEQQLTAVNKEIATTTEQWRQTIDQIAKEAQNVQNANNDLNRKRGERAKWHCIFRCRRKWKRAQRRRIQEAERVLNEARQRHSNAFGVKNEREAKLNNLHQRESDLKSALAKNRKESDQCKEKLLKSTHLTETVLQLLKDLSSLQLNVIHLKEELQARQDLDNEDLGVGWESITTPLNAISNYLSNGGFVKDLAGWGIDIKGFDVQSIRALGVDIDEKTARLLQMSP